MASYLLHTDNSSVPLVGDRMGPKCLFFGSGDDCGELGARPPGIEGWGAAGFIPCSMCCLLSSAQGGGFLPLVPGICSSPGPTDFPGTLSLEPGALVVV